jgi:hypothetical protein
MRSLSISPEQEQVLHLINRRLDQLDVAAGASVTSILAACHRLGLADRLAVNRRLMSIGAPNSDWAGVLNADR